MASALGYLHRHEHKNDASAMGRQTTSSNAEAAFQG